MLPLPGLGKQRVRINVVTQERLGLVTWAQAKAEVGTHKRIGEWQQAWVRRHDKPWVARYAALHGGVTSEDLERRFRTRWAKTDCWVLGFVILDDQPRYLANQRKVRSNYTHRSDRDHAIDNLPVMDPSHEYVRMARLEGERMRAQRKAQEDADRLAARAIRRRLHKQQATV